jgi:predicted dehydrogenase
MAEKIRLGLIGASVRGTWSARSHLPALQASSDVELTAVCTTRADSAEAARQAWGARLAFDDYRRMIASPEIDAVAVVVRVPSHYAPTKAALAAGKHVYCEWPLGRTTAEAVELSALSKAGGLVTAVGLLLRRRSRELVDHRQPSRRKPAWRLARSRVGNPAGITDTLPRHRRHARCCRRCPAARP